MKKPSAFEVALTVWPVPTSVRCTVAPGITAPLVSSTVPLMVELEFCANAATVKTLHSNRTQIFMNLRVIVWLLLESKNDTNDCPIEAGSSKASNPFET